MNSEELYNLLINFQEESLLQLGLRKKGEYWIHPNSTYRFDVHNNTLYVDLNGATITRLSAPLDDPERLYKTFIDTDIIEAGIHFLYLKEQGLGL